MKVHLLIILFLGLLLVGCSTYKITVDKTTVNPTNENHYHLIEDIAIFEQLVSNNKEFIIVAGQTTCGACLAYKELLNQYILETNVRIYYININEVPGSLEALRIQGELSTTPTTYIYQKSNSGESKLLNQFGYISDLDSLKSMFARYVIVE